MLFLRVCMNVLITLIGRRPGYPVLITSRNSLSVILTINLSRHNDSDDHGYALCQLKMVLSMSESELRDVNRTGYPVRRPGSVNMTGRNRWEWALLLNPSSSKCSGFAWVDLMSTTPSEMSCFSRFSCFLYLQRYTRINNTHIPLRII